MPRVKFCGDEQGGFLSDLKDKFMVEWSEIARTCGVHKRTLFDWRRNKYQISYSSLEKLKRKYRISVLKNTEILPDNWHVSDAARLGAVRRNYLYGNPGTPEGRRKGGIVTCESYKCHPEKFKNTNFIGPKEIKIPAKSSFLSELIGIILGDGSITKYQVTVSLNNKTDKQYSFFVSRLIKQLFNIKVTCSVRENNTCNLTASSVKLTGYLNKIGLKSGNKIRQQVGIPQWILKNKKYMIGCLRGLIDTDGGVYYHNHTTKGIRYRHLGLCFTSYSPPLLSDVYAIFLDLGFPAKISQAGHVFLYDRKAVKRYFAEIGTHNPHHSYRFKDYFRSGEVA